MSTYKPKVSPFWHFDFQFRGHRFHGSTRCRNRPQAEAVERAERERAKQTLKANSKSVDYLSIDEAAGRYWTEVGQHHVCSKETWTNLERLVSYFGKDKPLNEITDDEVARLVAWRRGPVIENFRFHDIRHDVGTKLLRETGNLKLVQKALNHADLKTTTRYAHVLDQEVAEALERVQKSRKKSRNTSRKVG